MKDTLARVSGAKAADCGVGSSHGDAGRRVGSLLGDAGARNVSHVHDREIFSKG